MFNKNDGKSSERDACCVAARFVPRHPRDYYLGLPAPQLVVPKNILFFSRQEAFEEGRGTEHHRFLLILCLEGEGDVLIDDQVERLRPGYAMLVTPHQFHHYARFTGGRLLWLFMTFELEDVEALDSLRGRALELSPLQMTCARHAAERYAGLRGKREADAGITLLASLLLEEFRGQTGRRRGEERVPEFVTSSRRLIQDVARYVHAHVTEPIHIADVARKVGLSESHLRARFCTLAGIGLGAYIRRLRLHRARTLMFASELRLKEIAERCGYDSIYSFSRAFRQEMGQSPSRYRKRQGDRGM